jgi:hypothetical protein
LHHWHSWNGNTVFCGLTWLGRKRARWWKTLIGPSWNLAYTNGDDLMSSNSYSRTRPLPKSVLACISLLYVRRFGSYFFYLSAAVCFSFAYQTSPDRT